MGLTSKWHYDTLLVDHQSHSQSQQFSDPQERRGREGRDKNINKHIDFFTADDENLRFLRLLEEDPPEMMACGCGCNVLYRWQRWQGGQYLCPNRVQHVSFKRGASWCTAHAPVLIYREKVDAFLRGWAKGPRYGPQLHKELQHTC
ncbi:hypothetical protein AYL99_11063 [Fonsecaea erecta]|uniref:Uncharacterized protein n=1 Tax=Fonsecaea erecta TaxID=1367422 RepID=A0A178Z6D1_9EURO|nr:hypothetical protein AYL99_11063 [Fonsecaea erecta]OAP54615.1 hypothetical protein AYL99_11063 [Fonsecaea erecta]